MRISIAITILLSLFVPYKAVSQYTQEDIIIETDISFSSIVSHYSDQCKLHVIAKSNDQSYFVVISANEELESITPIPIEPLEFVYIDNKIVYLEQDQIIQYDIIEESFQSNDIPFEIEEEHKFQKILFYNDILFINYTLYFGSNPAEVGLISVDYANLQLLEIKVPDLPYSGIIDYWYLLDLRLNNSKVHLEMGTSTGSGLFYRESILYNADLSVNRSITSLRTGAYLPPTPEAHHSANFTILDNEIRYDNKYTPQDGFIYVLSSSQCNSANNLMSTVDLHEFGTQYAYQIDDVYFLIHKDGGFKVYNCFYQEVGFYNGFPTVEQDECSIYYLFLQDGNIHKRKLSSPDYCSGDVLIRSQADIDNYNGCKLLDGNLLVDDQLDGSVDINDMTGLAELMHVTGSFRIENCPKLEALDGLSGSIAIEDSLVISNNELLDQCTLQFVCVEIATGNTRIENNLEGCNSEQEINEDCNDELCPDEPLNIDNCAAASQFRSKYPFCTELKSDLNIGSFYFDLPTPNLTFEELSFINSVDGSVSFGCFSTTDEAILNVDTVGGNININYEYYNPRTINFPFLDLVGGSVSYNSYYGLMTSNMPQLKTVGKDIIISENVEINNGMLEHIGRNLRISSTKIENLDFLSEVVYLGGDVIIEFNDKLSNCSIELICEAIADENQNVIIANNTGDCESLETVKANCGEDEDGDGYGSIFDCDDTDAAINPGVEEIVYDGIDNDCDESTLDDDLDEDGFSIIDDCDDTNAMINPDAEEIPENGIDEDCDGEDAITSSTSNLLFDRITIAPNPFRELITISNPTSEKITVELYTLLGESVLSIEFVSGNEKTINTANLKDGIYILRIQDAKGSNKSLRIIKS